MSYTIWKFHTDRFSVSVTADPDDYLDLSWDDDGSVREGLESGKYVAFQVAARVFYRGREIGADHLGGCIYESPDAFRDHLGIKRHEHCGSYFSDMVRQAISEARKTLSDARKANLRY